MFKQITCVSHNTLKFLCDKIGPYLQRKDTHRRDAISIESKVVMSLQKMGTRNTLCEVGEVYGMAQSAIHEIVRNFRGLVKVHL